MEPDQFDTWFGSGSNSGGPFPLDNAMLNQGSGADGGGAAGAGAAGAGARVRPPPPPRDFVGPDAATAIMTGAPEPLTDVYEIDTSCDDSDPDTEDDAHADGLQVTLDELFDGSAAAPGTAARAQRKRRKRPRHRMDCFGCTVSMAGTKGANDDAIQYTHMQTMQRMFNDLAPRMEKWTVARLLHTFYKESVYKPCALEFGASATDAMPPMWHTVEIYEHFYHHSYAPEVWLLNQIEEYQALSRMLYMSCASKTDGGSGVEPNEKVIAVKLRVDAHVRALRREPLDVHNFRSGEGGMDVHTAGAAFSPFREFKRSTG